MLSSQVKFSADRQTDGQTDTGKTICPHLTMRGHKKVEIPIKSSKRPIQTEKLHKDASSYKNRFRILN